MTECPQCEYQPMCKILSFLVRFGYVCRQGRKRKEYRQKQTTLVGGGEDST